MSTLTCELLGTTTIFASKILRKSSQKQSLNLSTFWLLSWTPFSVSLASRSCLFDDQKSLKSLPYPTWGAQDLAQGSQDALMMLQERAKEALGSPRRHFVTDFGLNFGANSTRFSTSRHLDALQASISLSTLSRTRHTVHKHMFVRSTQLHALHKLGETKKPNVLIWLYQPKYPINVLSISPCITLDDPSI